MNTNYNISNQRTTFGSADYCFQPYFVPNNQHSSFPIIQETPSKATLSNNEFFETKQSQQQQPLKSSELKFKIESVGIHPEDDDDLDMCPARTRPSWPKQIIPWWVATHPNEKPPYSYATLIAHAILSSKDGRLTLNDIYTWIANNYPTFSVGNGGWQNSIRHNLSLNKKWFYKIDRRPTQANPGKGCYWTLIAGTEQIFIDNLTQVGGHSKKHHDIGLTAELSIGQRRGACYYNNVPANVITPGFNHPSAPLPLQQTPSYSSNSCGLATPPPTPTKPDVSRPLLSPLYTTFRMVNMTEKTQRHPQQSENNDLLDDSDNDSGVDVSNEFVDIKHFRKRRRTTNCKASVASSPKIQPLQHVNTSMVYDTPTSTSVSSFGLIPTPSFEINNWVEHSLLYSEHQLYKNHDDDNNYHIQWPASSTVNSSTWCDSIVVLPPSNAKKRTPITINLDDDEVTQKYLHFEEDEEDLPFNSATTATTMPMLTNDINHNNTSTSTTNNAHYNLYPHPPIPSSSSITTTANTTTTSSSSVNPSSSSSAPLLHNYQLQQFVSMQDILYS